MAQIPVTARPLGKVAMTPLSEESAALSLIDTEGTASVYLINPEGLAAILLPLLGAAAHWADKPDFESEMNVSGPMAMPAQSIAIARGRSQTECALQVRIGKFSLTFLLPIEKVVEAFGPLAAMIEPDKPHDAH